MNKRQRKTLADIYEKPTRSDLSWRNVESLFNAIGSDIFEGEGSRVSVVFNNHEILVTGALREGKTSNAFVRDVLEKAVSEENKKIS
jgi:hypothetical protein